MKIYLVMKNYGHECEESDWTMFGGWRFCDAEYYTLERARLIYDGEINMRYPYPCAIWEVDIETGEINEVLGN